MRVECPHGDGNSEGSRATRRDVDSAGFAGEGSQPPVLPAFEPTAGRKPLRRVCGRALPAVLCGQAGTAEPGAGDVLSAAADRLFRGDRFRARDGLASARLVGAATVSAGGVGGIAAGSLDDFADAALDRSGDAPGSVQLGAAVAGGKRIAEGADAGN